MQYTVRIWREDMDKPIVMECEGSRDAHTKFNLAVLAHHPCLVSLYWGEELVDYHDSI